jgi:excisionase family DNA binding protein
MNDAVTQLYAEYLRHTDGDKSAAASLTLADMLRECQPVALAGATEPSDRTAVRPDAPLTVPEVAKLLRVRPDKVLSWIRSGRLRGYNVAERENGRPKYRVNPDDLRAFTQQRAVTQPAPKGRPVGRRRIPVIARPHL